MIFIVVNQNNYWVSLHSTQPTDYGLVIEPDVESRVALMNGLIAIAIFLWCMATLLSFVFATDPSESFLKRIGDSIRIEFHRSAGLKIIPSFFQAISIYWIVLGAIINWVGENWIIEGFTGDIVILAVMGAPLLVAAIIAGKRKDKDL